MKEKSARNLKIFTVSALICFVAGYFILLRYIPYPDSLNLLALTAISLLLGGAAVASLEKIEYTRKDGRERKMWGVSRKGGIIILVIGILSAIFELAMTYPPRIESYRVIIPITLLIIIGLYSTIRPSTK